MPGQNEDPESPTNQSQPFGAVRSPPGNQHYGYHGYLVIPEKSQNQPPSINQSIQPLEPMFPIQALESVTPLTLEMPYNNQYQPPSVNQSIQTIENIESVTPRTLERPYNYQYQPSSFNQSTQVMLLCRYI